MDGLRSGWLKNCHRYLVYNEVEIAELQNRPSRLLSVGRVCSVDKANVLDSSRLWRQVTKRLQRLSGCRTYRYAG